MMNEWKLWINPIGVHCSNNDMTLYSYCPNSNIDVPSQFLSSAWASVIHWEKYSLTWQNHNGEQFAGICWNILMAMFWDPQDIEKSHAMLHKNNQKHVEQWNIYMILTTIIVLCNLTEVHTCSSGSIRVQKNQTWKSFPKILKYMVRNGSSPLQCAVRFREPCSKRERANSK